MKTLLIENDYRKGEQIELTFQVGWPDVEIIRSSQDIDDSLTTIEKEYPDLLIIDYTSGAFCNELLKQIRLFSLIPIIIIAEGADELNIVEALECGADEFLNWPIGQLELLARIRAILRRQKPPRIELPYICGPLCLYSSSSQLKYKSKSINLTRTENLVFLHLLKNANKVVSYSSLADTLWGADYPGSIEAIRVCINRLEKKFKLHFNQSNLIKNKSGIGYSLVI